MTSSWTCRFVLHTHSRPLPHTQLNINEGAGTARKTRPGGTAIYGLKVIGQPSDRAVCRARWRGWRMSFAGEKRSRNSSSDVNRDIDEDHQQRWASGDDVVQQQLHDLTLAV